LALAVSEGLIDITRLLLPAGAGANAIDGCYETALIAVTCKMTKTLRSFSLITARMSMLSICNLALLWRLLLDAGHAAIVQLLSNHKRNPELQGPRYLGAIDGGMLPMVKLRMF
jgi:hypothetical protein